MADENKEIETINTADDKKRKIAGLAINVRRSLTYILFVCDREKIQQTGIN